MRKWTGAAALLCAVSLASCGGSETLGNSGGDGSDPDSEYRVGTLDGNNFSEGGLAIGQSDLAAGGSTSLSIDIVDDDNQLAFGVPVEVGFNSACISRGQASISSESTSTSTGNLTATYTASGCSGSDVVTAYVKVADVTLTAKGTVNVQSAQLGGLEFVSATPTVIGMSGSPLQSQSAVTFLLRDNTGAPLSGRTVNFSLTTAPGGATLTPASAKSDSAGLVRTTVQAGSVHSSVRVKASTTASGGQTISTQSGQLVITTGLPDQDSFSLAAENLSLNGGCDGASTKLTIRAADRYNNPVPAGTAISFTTEGGKINGQCTTAAALEDPTAESGACSVLLTVQNPRPANGRITVLATALGEESFVDSNGNGFRDAGESFGDLPEAFVDYDEDGGRDSNEPIVDFDGDGAYDGVNGIFDGYVCEAAGVSCRSDLVDVRDSMVIVFADLSRDPVITGAPASLSLSTGETRGLSFTIRDRNGNSLPSGTTYTLSSSRGSASTPTVGPFATTNGDVASFSFTAGSSAGTGTVTLTIAAPGGGCGDKTFTLTFPITVIAPASTP